MAGVNQLERDLLLMRQRERMVELAKEQGKYKGRTKKYHNNHARMEHAIELYKAGNMSVSTICEITNVSKTSLYRQLNVK